MSLSFVVGVGVVVLSLFIFSSLIDKEKHKYLRTILLLIGVPLLFLIPGNLVQQQEVCDVVINSTNYNGSHTYYDYDTFCYEKNDNSGTFAVVMSVVVLIFAIYVIFMVWADIIKVLNNLRRRL